MIMYDIFLPWLLERTKICVQKKTKMGVFKLLTAI